MVLLTVAWLAGFPFGLSGVAFAQGTDDDARARELYDNGALLYDEGRYEEAIRAWQEAHDLSGRPLLVYNIANAQERLGLWQEALDSLNEYRIYASEQERVVLERRMRSIERRIEAQRATEVVTPVPVEPAPVVVEPVQEPSRALPLGLIGGGVAAAGVGGVFAVRARLAGQEAAESCNELAGMLLCQQPAEPALKRQQISAWVADGGLLVGVTGVTAGVLLLSLGGSDADLHVELGPSHLGVGGRF